MGLGSPSSGQKVPLVPKGSRAGRGAVKTPEQTHFQQHQSSPTEQNQACFFLKLARVPQDLRSGLSLPLCAQDGGAPGTHTSPLLPQQQQQPCAHRSSEGLDQSQGFRVGSEESNSRLIFRGARDKEISLPLPPRLSALGLCSLGGVPWGGRMDPPGDAPSPCPHCRQPFPTPRPAAGATDERNLSAFICKRNPLLWEQVLAED